MVQILVGLGLAIAGFTARLLGSAWLQRVFERTLGLTRGTLTDEQRVQQEADRVNAWLRTQPNSTLPKEDQTP